METWVQLLLSALLVLNLLVMGLALAAGLHRMGALGAQIGAVAARLEGQMSAALDAARATLARVETLSDSVERLTRDEVTPTLLSARATLAHVETATRSLAEGAADVRRIVGGAEQLSTPAALAAAAANMLRQPGGRAGLLALAAGVAARALLAARRRPQAGRPGR